AVVVRARVRVWFVVVAAVEEKGVVVAAMVGAVWNCGGF
ncbi:hypothetical protein Tco_0470000, partial [Tanacetum coccineum]